MAIAPGSPAYGAAGLATAPSLPPEVTEGATALAGSVALLNTSSAPDGAITVCNAGDGGACAGSPGITVTPSCGRTASVPACAADGADPGVFAIRPTATGAPATACDGMTFSVAASDAQGGFRFTPAGGLAVKLPAGFGPVGSAPFCRIDFEFDVLKMPSIDARPDVEGVQTIAFALARGVSNLGGSAVGRGAAAAVTVTPAPVPPVPGGAAAGDPAGAGPDAPPSAGPADPGCPVFGLRGSGSAADDRLTGGTGIDIIHGLGGADVLRGGAGRDCLYGDAGADILQGGAAADFLFGGAGRDRIVGQAGGDRLNGEAGNDQLVGGPGADRMSGGGGADLIDARDPTRRDRRLVETITCGAGRDIVRADARDDVASDCERVQRRS